MYFYMFSATDSGTKQANMLSRSLLAMDVSGIGSSSTLSNTNRNTSIQQDLIQTSTSTMSLSSTMTTISNRTMGIP